jgi:hypothetical protein
VRVGWSIGCSATHEQRNAAVCVYKQHAICYAKLDAICMLEAMQQLHLAICMLDAICKLEAMQHACHMLCYMLDVLEA